MADTSTLRICTVTYNDKEEGLLIFSAGWNIDPDDRYWQDDLRLASAKRLAGIPEEFLTSVRFVEVAIPIIGDISLPTLDNG